MNPTNTTTNALTARDPAIGQINGPCAAEHVARKRERRERRALAGARVVPSDSDSLIRITAALERLEDWAAATPTIQHPRHLRLRNGAGLTDLSTVIKQTRNAVDFFGHPCHRGDKSRSLAAIAEYIESVSGWVLFAYSGGHPDSHGGTIMQRIEVCETWEEVGL